ncbi:unnamed protein product [Blepharisma stoltei]|uniref:COP9 signalosome complex subunit 6 n=1 Tax=Blepharisma stoltei TaxID=1481888 RepID=A0AAU9JJZ8_9CILI|nr:unnamed protein product [Blepharisma stoltei]
MSLEVCLHPLVLMNISDHFTRAFANKGSPQRVIGILVGTVSGRNIQIQNSFEALWTSAGENTKLDTEFIEKKLSMLLEIFPNYEFLGWYSTGKLHERDMLIQRSLVNFNENPLYLVLNTVDPPPKESEDLPVELYESHVQVMENQTNYQFKQLTYTIETTDPERIAVDYVSRAGAATGEFSEYSSNLMTFLSAMRLFKKRLLKLVEMVAGNSDVQKDHKLMRKLNEICNRIPVAPFDRLKDDFNQEISEELMTTYMAAMSKGSSHTSELLERFDFIAMSRDLD